jgi:hypothetical protein
VSISFWVEAGNPLPSAERCAERHRAESFPIDIVQFKQAE